MMSSVSFLLFVFSSRRRHTRCLSDWSSDVCSSDLKPPQSHHKATSMRPQSHPGGIANGQSQIAEATFSVPIRAISARKFRRNTGYQGGAKGLKAMWGGGKLWPVAWSITGLEFTYAIIRKPCRERDTRARHFPGGGGCAHLRRLRGWAEGELPDAIGTVCRDAAGGGWASKSADRGLDWKRT